MSGIQSNVPHVKIPIVVGAKSNVASTAASTISDVKSVIPNVSAPTSIPTQVPSVESFGGTGKAGILANASPTFLKNVAPKFQSMVPSFVPGMTVNFGSISGAISAISAAKGSASMLGQIKGSAIGQLNSMTQNIQGQLDTGKIEDVKSMQSIQSQVDSAKQDVNGTIDVTRAAVNESTNIVQTQ